MAKYEGIDYMVDLVDPRTLRQCGDSFRRSNYPTFAHFLAALHEHLLIYEHDLVDVDDDDEGGVGE